MAYRRKPFSTYSAPGFSSLTHLSIKGDHGVGQKSEQTYDPFELYYAWKERRAEHAPPHLEFANLDEDDASVKLFLKKYGALTHRVFDADHPDIDYKLRLDWLWSVQEAKEEYEEPESYYRKHLLIRAITLPLKSDARPDLVRVNLSEFWAEQEKFLFVQKLWEALRNRRNVSQIRRLFFGATRPRSRVRYGLAELTPSLLGDLQIILKVPSPVASGRRPFAEELGELLSGKIRALSNRALLRAARNLIMWQLNHHLAQVGPVLRPEYIRRRRFQSLRPTWQCETLLQSFYMMCFLDITLIRRIVRCNGCGILFGDSKENVHFCSKRCEERARARKWWQRHGREYRRRQKQQRSSAV